MNTREARTIMGLRVISESHSSQFTLKAWQKPVEGRDPFVVGASGYLNRVDGLH